jgi:hypothetical protein
VGRVGSTRGGAGVETREVRRSERLIIVGLMSNCVPCQSERRAFARGFLLDDGVMCVLRAIVRVVSPFMYLNFANGGVSATG